VKKIQNWVRSSVCAVGSRQTVRDGIEALHQNQDPLYRKQVSRASPEFSHARGHYRNWLKGITSHRSRHFSCFRVATISKTACVPQKRFCQCMTRYTWKAFKNRWRSRWTNKNDNVLIIGWLWAINEGHPGPTQQTYTPNTTTTSDKLSHKIQESHAVAGKPRDAAVNSDRYQVCWHFAGAILAGLLGQLSAQQKSDLHVLLSTYLFTCLLIAHYYYNSHCVQCGT